MKQGTHPKYTLNAPVACACGNTFEVGSTLTALRIELCSACHPFYTGKQNFVDTARRIEKFQEKATKLTSKSDATRTKSEKEVARKAKRAEKKAVGK